MWLRTKVVAWSVVESFRVLNSNLRLRWWADTSGLRLLTFLAIRNGVPAKISTSRYTTTRASNVRLLLARDKFIWASPKTVNGVTPSACKACWEDLSMMIWRERATDALIMLVSAPVSSLIVNGHCL